MNARRNVLRVLGAAALTLPLRAFAQQPGKIWRVGFLSGWDKSHAANARFLHGMRGLGYIEGRNLAIDWRFGEHKPEAIAALAADLARLNPDLILAAGQLAVGAAQKATATIPIVMGGGVGDPVAAGFIRSLPQPGGNITGMSLGLTDLSTKHLGMLRAASPKLSRVAVLTNPLNKSHETVLRDIHAAARALNLGILHVPVRSPKDIEGGFATMAREKVGAVYMAGDGMLQRQERRIAALATKQRMPTVTITRQAVEAGFLMSYGPNLPEQFVRAAAYVDKIFKGAKPGELPVEQPTKFEMVLNRRTAKALGITLPQSLLVQADEVIG